MDGIHLLLQRSVGSGVGRGGRKPNGPAVQRFPVRFARGNPAPWPKAPESRTPDLDYDLSLWLSSANGLDRLSWLRDARRGERRCLRQLRAAQSGALGVFAAAAEPRAGSRSHQHRHGRLRGGVSRDAHLDGGPFQRRVQPEPGCAVTLSVWRQRLAAGLRVPPMVDRAVRGLAACGPDSHRAEHSRSGSWLHRRPTSTGRRAR